MKTKFIGFVLVLLSSISYAQQDAQFTQYMYNTIVVNPAYAGSRETLSVFALHRTQWVGQDGAPVTNNLSLNTPISKNLGLGVSILNDRIGPQDKNNIAVDLSYSVPVSENYKLSLGIKGSASLLNVDFTKLHLANPGDPRYQENIDNKFLPNIGAGIYLHSNKAYVGFSAPYILESKHYDESGSTSSFIATEKIHYYFIGGYVFDLSPSLQFKPSLLTKIAQGTPLQADLSANFLINQKFTAGLAYRWDAAYSALVGFQASNSWFIGYAYDRDATKFANNNSGSHEVFLRYELFTKKNIIISPRFF
ncbi:type IX secretion system membrane protein PorP/SprF [Flavobacterium sp. NG2]|uniref:PorP/SprF family type IX secretion system membrane protein n=1 Tax=Flavobacterium sp. NG2 TaxID=3097547 RepID=UPI002A823714|nr:type IX secretion system membrane protein PorP/SprF [Flavobacterium sp. NG2]WPR72692.1 type IX secretion system membrane protein PorP/SprF [Flavobacterium sp. NG2]